jgi:hypothetical protein
MKEHEIRVFVQSWSVATRRRFGKRRPGAASFDTIVATSRESMKAVTSYRTPHFEESQVIMPGYLMQFVKKRRAKNNCQL